MMHPAGLEAQVSVGCHKTKLVSVLLKEEPAVPLLVIWAKLREIRQQYW